MKILLTGAAGLLGGDLAGALVARGYEVTGLVHRNRAIIRNDGAVLPEEAIATIAGDIREPRFGLTETAFRELARTHDLVIHCAAATGFGLHDATYRSVNIDGAAHAVALARAAEAPLIHVSTAYVCGDRDGPVAEDETGVGDRFRNGYEASKAEAERLVRESGVASVIVRPGIVVGASGSGAIRSFDTIYAAFRLITEGRIAVLPASPSATLAFVPIDHVTGGLVDIVGALDRAVGRTIHLTADESVTVTDFIDAIGGFPGLHVPRLIAPEHFDPDALPASERRLHKSIAALYAAYFQRNPVFANKALRSIGGRACPPTGPDFLRALIGHCIDVGYLRPVSGDPDSGGRAVRARRSSTAARP